MVAGILTGSRKCHDEKETCRGDSHPAASASTSDVLRPVAPRAGFEPATIRLTGILKLQHGATWEPNTIIFRRNSYRPFDYQYMVEHGLRLCWSPCGPHKKGKLRPADHSSENRMVWSPRGNVSQQTIRSESNGLDHMIENRMV